IEVSVCAYRQSRRVVRAEVNRLVQSVEQVRGIGVEVTEVGCVGPGSRFRINTSAVELHRLKSRKCISLRQPREVRGVDAVEGDCVSLKHEVVTSARVNFEVARDALDIAVR